MTDREEFLDFSPKSNNPIKVLKQVFEELEQRNPGKKIVVSPDFLMGFINQLDGPEEDKDSMIMYLSTLDQNEALSQNDAVSLIRSMISGGGK